MTHLVIGTTSPLRITLNRNARLKIKGHAGRHRKVTRWRGISGAARGAAALEVSPVWRCRVSPGRCGWRFQVRGQRWDSAWPWWGSTCLTWEDPEVGVTWVPGGPLRIAWLQIIFIPRIVSRWFRLLPPRHQAAATWIFSECIGQHRRTYC